MLAAVSATKALYFEPYLMEDPNYPPSQNTTRPNRVQFPYDGSLGRGQKNGYESYHLKHAKTLSKSARLLTGNKQ